MKQYGSNKATEFTRKQIGVIYSKAKNGELKVEKWMMSELYDLADYYGYDDSRSVEECEREILAILEAVFDGETEKAQLLISAYADKHFNLMSKKIQSKINRTIFVD